MCQRCVELFKTIHPNILNAMDKYSSEFYALMDKIVNDIKVPLIQIDGNVDGEPEERQDLPKDAQAVADAIEYHACTAYFINFMQAQKKLPSEVPMDQMIHSLSQRGAEEGHAYSTVTNSNVGITTQKH